MKRPHLLAIYLAIVAAWIQILAPVAMAQARPDPFSIICSHSADDTRDKSHPARPAAQHDCCTLCHAQLGALNVDDRPPFTFLDYPVASPLRWRVVALSPTAGPDPNQHRPRGPPALI